MLHRPPSQFGVPELPGVVGPHGSPARVRAGGRKRGLTEGQQYDIIMMSSTTSEDIERSVMLWYNLSPEIVRIVTETTRGNEDGRRRREMLRLIGRPDGH